MPNGRYLKNLIILKVAKQHKIINLNVVIIHSFLFSMYADDDKQHFS